MAHSTTDKLGVGSKTLTDCAYDPHWPKRLHPDAHRLQIHWPGLHITAAKPQKSGQGPWNGLTAPSINWRWVQKRSQTVHMTSIDQKDFTQTAIDYKSTDPGLHVTAKRPWKSGQRGHRMGCSAINKSQVDSKTFTDGPWGLHGWKMFHPDTHRLHIHWPGMHITAGRPQKSGPRATGWFTAPSINWRWAQKHSQIVHKTSVDQRYFTQTAIDCKSTDLEYTLQQRDYKEKRPQNAESFQKA